MISLVVLALTADVIIIVLSERRRELSLRHSTDLLLVIHSRTLDFFLDSDSALAADLLGEVWN